MSFIHTHWAAISAVATMLALSGISTAYSVWGTPTDPNAARTPIQNFLLFLKLWATAVAPEGYKGVVGKASVPFLHYPKPADPRLSQNLPPPPAAGGSAAASLLVMFASGTLFATAVMGIIVVGCVTSHGVVVSAYCSDPAHAEEARCKAEKVGVNCGAPEIVTAVKSIVGRVYAALMSQNFTNLLADIENDLKTQGQVDAPAIITCAILESTSKSTLSTASNDERTAVTTRAQLWRKDHPVNVKARVQ